MQRRATLYRQLTTELGAYAERQEAKGAGYERYSQAARIAAPMAAAAALAYEAGDAEAGQAAETLLDAFRAEGVNRMAISAPYAACGLT
jgi:hypothetical protein